MFVNAISKKFAGKTVSIKKLNDTLYSKLHIIDSIFINEESIPTIAKLFWDLIENCYKIVSYLIISPIFPRELLIPYTYQIINDISQGVNAWDCLAQLLSSIHDIKFPFDLTQCNINFQDEIFNPRVPVSVIH